MSEATKCEVAMMWLYGDEYSRQSLSARDYWKQLDPSKKRFVRDMLRAVEKCDRFDRESDA